MSSWGTGSYPDLRCTAVFRKVPEGYIAFIEEFPGANTQGASLEEARTNLREAVALVIEANREMARQDASGGAVIREPKKVSTIPRHKEINRDLARKICKDLQVPRPQGS